jgi:hypothetical protein
MSSLKRSNFLTAFCTAVNHLAVSLPDATAHVGRMANTKRASRKPSRRAAPKLAATEATGLPRQIAEETVLNEAYLGVPSPVVRSADIGATHDPKTSFAAGPTKKTFPASAQEKHVEQTTSARPFEPINNDAFGAAAEAALSFCFMSMGFAARRMSGGLQLALNLARARDLSQVVELQTAYWRQQLDEAAAQIETSQTLIKKFVTSTRSCEDKPTSACRSHSRS